MIRRLLLGWLTDLIERWWRNRQLIEQGRITERAEMQAERIRQERVSNDVLRTIRRNKRSVLRRVRDLSTRADGHTPSEPPGGAQ